MVMSPAASLPGQDNGSLIGEADLLPRHPVFRARDLEPARSTFPVCSRRIRLAYLTREHPAQFSPSTRQELVASAVELNALQFGGDVMVTAPHIPDYFLLQFTAQLAVARSRREAELTICGRVPSPSSIPAGPSRRACRPMAASSSCG